MTQQKQRKHDERARAKGGGMRGQPTEGPPGRSASTGGLTTRGMLHSDDNSRSSKQSRRKQ